MTYNMEGIYHTSIWPDDYDTSGSSSNDSESSSDSSESTEASASGTSDSYTPSSSRRPSTGCVLSVLPDVVTKALLDKTTTSTAQSSPLGDFPSLPEKIRELVALRRKKFA